MVDEKKHWTVKIPKPDKGEIEARTGRVVSALESVLDKSLPEFDPDFSPNNPINVRAAQVRDLTYDPDKRSYVDSDGCLIRDEFGQPY